MAHNGLKTSSTISGTTAWRSPSNIALVKYWGKFGMQLPSNPSLSFSLSKAFTETSIEYTTKANPDETSLEFFFENKRNASFEKRIQDYLYFISNRHPFLRQLQLKIRSVNSFPHSSGIASSASAFSALALNICSIAQQHFNVLQDAGEFFQEASELARLGSGSACRSVFPSFALWGQTEKVPGSNNNFAVPLERGIHENFKNLNDSIFIVSQETKAISSSVGHSLMNGHPFSKARFKQAKNNTALLLDALEIGDYEKFIELVETEAMSLHAMMMSSTPSFVLLKPKSLEIIQKIKDYRQQSRLPICFTIDAGPNIHLIYPASIETSVKDFIQNDLLVSCGITNWIDDKLGNGPQKLEFST
jgi:diphosphomevalonate decarboxylase